MCSDPTLFKPAARLSYFSPSLGSQHFSYFISDFAFGKHTELDTSSFRLESSS